MNHGQDTQRERSFPRSAGEPTSQERQWAFLGHLAAFAGLVLPFGNLLGPFVVWQIKKDTMPFAGEHAKEALNFQITVTLALIVSALLMFLLIGFLLLPIIAIGALILTLVAAVKANNGEAYRYPFAWRPIP